MAQKKKRAIRMDQFVKQLDEIGISDLQEVELDGETSVFMLLGVGVDIEKSMDVRARVDAAENADEAAEAILDYHPDPEITGLVQLQRVKDAGWKPDQIVALWGVASADMREEMGKLRPKRS